ncbi:MAG: DUF819 family protein [Saprospiraceae bacterium]|nr:DUF819 family protein [Saprospiraceae bacterium]
MSDIVLCYGIGMLLGNTKSLWLWSWLPGESAEALAGTIATTSQITAFASVLLAIPLLLMLCDVTEWLQYTGKITKAFLLGVLAVVGVTITMGYIYQGSLEQVETTAGMMAGVYVGGTPNMVAISKALAADDQLFLLLNATDALCSGLYFLFLLSLGKPILGRLLPNFQAKQTTKQLSEGSSQLAYLPFPPKQWQWTRIRPLLFATLLGLGAVIIAAGLASLFPDSKGEPNQTILMLTLTTLGIGLSFIPSIRQLKGVFNYAQYLLLTFGLAAGFLADFTELISMGSSYLAFNALVLVGIVGIHYLLAVLFRIDSDSFILSSTAATMGPPFVVQMASSIKNQELLPVAISLSILGLALGNYIGIFVAWILGL